MSPTLPVKISTFVGQNVGQAVGYGSGIGRVSVPQLVKIKFNLTLYFTRIKEMDPVGFEPTTSSFSGFSSELILKPEKIQFSTIQPYQNPINLYFLHNWEVVKCKVKDYGSPSSGNRLLCHLLILLELTVIEGECILDVFQLLHLTTLK